MTIAINHLHAARERADRQRRMEQALADYCDLRRDGYQLRADDLRAEVDRLDDAIFQAEEASALAVCP